MKPKTKPVCKHCGSDDIIADAYVAWDNELQDWSLVNVFEDFICNNCDVETNIKWVEIES
jgi:hypothetical protein